MVKDTETQETKRFYMCSECFKHTPTRIRTLTLHQPDKKK